MKILHVNVEADDGWLIGQGLEEPAVITQARSFDELVANVREVCQLLRFAKNPYIVLIVPQSVPVKAVATRAARRAG